MTPRVFFDAVAAVNAELAVRNPDDMRHAVNAIMALDAFFGILHASRQGTPGVPSNDSAWKEQLANKCADYRLVRDTAYTLKHGQLTSEPRLVRHPDQLFSVPGGFQADAFQTDFVQRDQVWIETQENDYKANEVIEKVTEFARLQLSAP